MLKSYQSRALCVRDRVYVVTHRIIVLAPVPLTSWDLLGLSSLNLLGLSLGWASMFREGLKKKKVGNFPKGGGGGPSDLGSVSQLFLFIYKFAFQGKFLAYDSIVI